MLLDYIDLGPVPVFLAAAVVLCVVPGPDVAYVVGAGLAGGVPAATRAAFGIALGMTAYVVATAFGVGVALSAQPHALAVIQLAGAAYLAWMAWTTVRDVRSGAPEVRDDVGAWFRRGLVVNLTNPKILLFFVAFLPQFVGDARSPALQLALLGLLLQLVGLVNDLVFGWSAGAVSTRLLGRPGPLRAVKLASAAVFAVLACTVVVDSVTTFA